MKKLKILGVVLFAAAIGSGIYSFTLGNEAPQKVKNAFAKKFPAVKKVKWDKESDTEWEAEFKMKGIEYSANFLTDGTWKETEHEIKKNDIPTNIKTVLDTQFAGYKIEESEISETNKGSLYEFELEKDKKVMEVAIDNDGKVLKKEMKDKNRKEDKD